MTTFLLQRFLYGIIVILRSTYRIRYVGTEQLQQARAAHPQQSVVLACWHEHLIGVLCSHRNLHTIISRHQFGQILGYICGKFGYQIFYGSADRGADKGGLRALLGLSRALRRGASVCVTVDGSIGPRRQAKKGVFELAQQSGARMVPLAIVANRSWEFNTWDRLKLPKPFARIVVVYGSPFAVGERSGDRYEVMSVELGRAIDRSEEQGQEELQR